MVWQPFLVLLCGIKHDMQAKLVLWFRNRPLNILRTSGLDWAVVAGKPRLKPCLSHINYGEEPG